KFLFTYLDDSRLGSKTAAEHLAHLDQFFAVLAANGMVINLSKCTFMVPELEVLGLIINSIGTTPIPQHIQVITDYPPPRTRNSCNATWAWSTSTAVSHQVLQRSWSPSQRNSK
ncbi:MAG: reverse transcriptase domain-containing protein, partial [bacterium]